VEHLYYCSVCKAKVDVCGPNNAPTIKWSCGHDGQTVIAPRKVTLYGEGGMDLGDKIKLAARQIASWATGLNV